MNIIIKYSTVSEIKKFMCRTPHLINNGVSITNDIATVEFSSQGTVQEYYCQLDMMKPYECKYK